MCSTELLEGRGGYGYACMLMIQECRDTHSRGKVGRLFLFRGDLGAILFFFLVMQAHIFFLNFFPYYLLFILSVGKKKPDLFSSAF